MPMVVIPAAAILPEVGAVPILKMEVRVPEAAKAVNDDRSYNFITIFLPPLCKIKLVQKTAN